MPPQRAINSAIQSILPHRDDCRKQILRFFEKKLGRGRQRGQSSDFSVLISLLAGKVLVPGLADYLRQNAPVKVQDAIDRYSHMAPYWTVGHHEQVQHENASGHHPKHG